MLSWISSDDSVQLGFPGFLASESPESEELLQAVRQHLAGLREIVNSMRESAADIERASLIKQIRRVHGDRSIVAFSEYADTVHGLFRELVNEGRIAALTASGARVAGGTISRSEAIERFAPNASGRRPPSESNAITLLLTTDLLSEGVNLQDAGIVIHLDLPWTPARMEQRLGRVARVGSQYERVQSYAFRPPISGDSVVRIEAILRQKLKAAGIVVPVPSILGWTGELDSPTAPERNETIRSLIMEWLPVSGQTESSSRCVTGVSAEGEGFIALAACSGRIRVVASIGGVINDDPETILQVLQQCCGSEADLADDDILACERSAIEWIQADAALSQSSSSKRVTTSIRSFVAKRIHRILRECRTHQRPALTTKTEKALTAIEGNLGAYDELRLQNVCDHVTDPERFLDEVVQLIPAKPPPLRSSPRILAMIVLAQRDALSPATKC